MKHRHLGFALLCGTIWTSPTGAEPYVLDGLLRTTDPGENAETGEYFWLCDYHGGNPHGFDYARDGLCGPDGTVILTLTRPFFEHFTLPFDAGPPPHSFSVGSGSLLSNGDPNENKEGSCCSGDDSGIFSIYAAPPPAPPGNPALDPDSKKFYGHTTNVLAGMAGAAGYGAFVSPPPVSTALAALTAMLAILAAETNELLNDPIDNDYRTIATPQPFPVPTDLLAANSCLSQLGPKLGKLISLTQAASTSYNRMQGALVAGDHVWATRQGKAMLKYANTAETALSNATNNPKAIWGCLPLLRAPADPDSITTYATNLATNGMRPEVTAAFTAIGVNDQYDLSNENGFLFVQDPNVVSTAFQALFGNRANRPIYWQTLLTATDPQP